jgi:hypothetical protein
MANTTTTTTTTTTGYSSSCTTVNDITITAFGNLGVARAFVFKYEFKPAIVTGLNLKNSFLVYARPIGIGEVVHVLFLEGGGGTSFTKLDPCREGSVEVRRGGSSSALAFKTDKAYLVGVEGRITVEQYLFIESLRFYFFDYSVQ